MRSLRSCNGSRPWRRVLNARKSLRARLSELERETDDRVWSFWHDWSNQLSDETNEWLLEFVEYRSLDGSDVQDVVTWLKSQPMPPAADDPIWSRVPDDVRLMTDAQLAAKMLLECHEALNNGYDPARAARNKAQLNELLKDYRF